MLLFVLKEPVPHPFPRFLPKWLRELDGTSMPWQQNSKSPQNCRNCRGSDHDFEVHSDLGPFFLVVFSSCGNLTALLWYESRLQARGRLSPTELASIGVAAVIWNGRVMWRMIVYNNNQIYISIIYIYCIYALYVYL